MTDGVPVPHNYFRTTHLYFSQSAFRQHLRLCLILLPATNKQLQYICTMKFVPIIIFSILIYFVINNVSSDNWNIGIYGLFVSFFGYKLFVNLRHLYKIRRSPVCDGLIVSYTKQKPEEVEEINYDIEVKFYSPLNNQEYIIKSGIKVLPKDDLVDVVFDELYPRHSKVYPKFNLWENIFLGLPLIFFMYQLFKIIFDH